jgi:formylglycine-generating enzyme required for sulfatase activity
MAKKQIIGVHFTPAFLVVLLLLFLFSSCPQPNGGSTDENSETGLEPPAAPGGLVAGSGNKKLYVSWQPVAEATEYQVYWNAAATPPAEPGLTISVVNTVIPNLVNAQEYTVWLKAVNSAGQSDFSLPAKGTPAVRPLPAQYTGFETIPGKAVSGSGSYAFTVTVPSNPPGYTEAGKTSTRNGVFVEGRMVDIDSFAMAKYETTQDLWFAVQEWALEEGYQFQNKKNVPNEANKNKPVAGISWRDALVWCNAYSEMAELEPVYYYPTVDPGNILKDSRTANAAACNGAVMDKTKTGFRLPTEVEREFAARGGDPGRVDWMYMYAGSDNADAVAWYHGNSAFALQEAGKKNANYLGIYDLSGNVQEWCWDWMNWATDVTAATPADGAPYSTASAQKAFNGGGVGSNITMSCVTYRWGFAPTYTDNYVGFRIVRKP